MLEGGGQATNGIFHMFDGFYLETSKKKHCIFYDIWQKGRGSKDQNQISEKKLNLDKFLGGVGKRLQCHKNSYLKN